jgi:hypothetical protein
MTGGSADAIPTEPRQRFKPDELPPVEEDHRFADGQFLGYLTDRCQGGR